MALRDSLAAIRDRLLFQKGKITGSGGLHAVRRELAAASRKHEEERLRKKEAEAQRQLIQKDIATKKHEEELKVAQDEERKRDMRLLKKRKRARVRHSHKHHLMLAGINTDLLIIYKRIYIATVIVTGVLTFYAAAVKFFFDETFRTASGVWSFVGFTAALWTVGFAALFMFFTLAFFVYVDLRINKRRKEIEEVLPDFLQLAAANLSAGMTLDRALWSAVRPRFGVLAAEMEDAAKKTITGYDLERALTEFSDKYDSIVLKRSINLVTEGSRSGGRMADILNKIAVNVQENAILQKEMSANVTTYVIFISFASVLAAPFLFGLATQLLIVIKEIAGGISTQGATSTGLSINPDVVKTSDFRLFSITILTASSIMSAAIVSVIRKGNIKDGIRLLPFFWLTTVSIYAIATAVLGMLFGGLV